MNLYFNDLTATGQPTKDVLLIRKFLDMFRSFSNATGEYHVWVPKSLKVYLSSCFSDPANLTLWSLINGIFGIRAEDCPYEPPEVEERFLRSVFRLKTDSGLTQCDQMGLAVVSKPRFAKMSLTVGFADSGFWQRLRYQVLEQCGDEIQCSHDALCVVNPDQIIDPSVRDWCQCSYDRVLPTTDTPIEDKQIHFRDDHGIDVLQAFARRLIRSPYIIGVLNSLPFDSAARRFIERVYDDGIVHIRLTNTELGLGMKIKTTARCIDEAERIAKIIESQFGN